MTEISISEVALDHVIQRLDSFVWTDKDSEEREVLRTEFQNTYNRERIDRLTPEDYFAGLGRKKGCLAYDLEWGTRPLGSIKGGSKYKYGYETDFPKIKNLLQKVVNIDTSTLAIANSAMPETLKRIERQSKEINGFKTGRTVIPKLLSIYYPDVFLPIFNDQDHFLAKLLTSGLDTENTGLGLYLEYNFKLLKVKKNLEDIIGRTLENFAFARLLYQAFPKHMEETIADGLLADTEALQDEIKFEALEVQHYQTLLHRNMPRLFPRLKYFDEEEQMRKNGQYDTQTVGIMDMLCTDEHGDFVIIEIKRQATDKTIGQILRYMGWTKEELCKAGQKVSGLIVAERKDVHLEFALKVMPEVQFMKLGLTISLEVQ